MKIHQKTAKKYKNIAKLSIYKYSAIYVYKVSFFFFGHIIEGVIGLNSGTEILCVTLGNV